MKTTSSAGQDTRMWPQRPGFKSQVLQNLMLFFISNSHTALTLMFTILHQNAPSTCPRAFTSKARIGKHATLQSNASHWIKKSQQILTSNWARPFRLAPPNSNPHPWFNFYFFSFFLIFLIFYYYLCFLFWFN